MPEQNNLYIGAAFAVTWLTVIGYAFHLRRARAAAERRMALARETIGRSE